MRHSLADWAYKEGRVDPDCHSSQTLIIFISSSKSTCSRLHCNDESTEHLSGASHQASSPHLHAKSPAGPLNRGQRRTSAALCGDPGAEMDAGHAANYWTESPLPTPKHEAALDRRQHAPRQHQRKRLVRPNMEFSSFRLGRTIGLPVGINTAPSPDSSLSFGPH